MIQNIYSLGELDFGAIFTASAKIFGKLDLLG